MAACGVAVKGRAGALLAWKVAGRPSVSQRCQPPLSTFAFVWP